MEAEDLMDLPASSDSGCGIETNELHYSICDSNEANSQPGNSEVKEEDNVERENLGFSEGIVGNEDSQVVQQIDVDKDSVDNPSILQDSILLTESVTAAENLNRFSSGGHTENGCLTAQDETPISNRKIDGSPISGVKRARMTFDEQQPSVHVIYNSLTRDSKRKLEELLQQWSEWHAQHASSSHDPNKGLESGEETYFPALHVGLDKSSAVSFWMDNQTRKEKNTEFVPMDGDSAPIYDRGYAFGLTSLDGSSNLEGALEIIDASRCFNCCSYNHSLKECPKPRDNVAVNNARKQHKSRRTQNAGARNPTRYYQNSPGGKFDGLRPGVLGAETRKLLGLGELDPPPWLNRMREMGYPPGYLDPEDEDQPSGITIYADEEIKEEKEDGEILDTDNPEPQRKMSVEFPGINAPQRKMSVEFPGINAPIPENADERRWEAGASDYDPRRNRSHRRLNHSSEPNNQGHYREQRWPRDFRDDGPPGSEQGGNPSMSSYPQRYSDYDSSYTSHSPRDNIPIPRNPILGRSVSDRGRWNPLVHGGSSNHDSRSSLSYSSPNRRSSQQNYRSTSSEYYGDESRNDFTPDYSSYGREKHDGHHYHSRR